jgi:hypothetical protein
MKEDKKQRWAKDKRWMDEEFMCGWVCVWVGGWVGVGVKAAKTHTTPYATMQTHAPSYILHTINETNIHNTTQYTHTHITQPHIHVHTHTHTTRHNTRTYT